MGGDGKEQDFSPLAEPIARYARAAVLIGRDAALIRDAIQLSGVPLLEAKTLPEAVLAAKDVSQKGDAILLSPACASFDMFKDYGHRAKVFCEAVADIADAAGQAMEGSL
jgi:UDP-N-acetylmuramoylalanine--D-glutamate ligase